MTMSATPQSTASPASEQRAQGTGYKCGLCRDTGFRPAAPRGAAGLAQAASGVVPCSCVSSRTLASPGGEGPASSFESAASISEVLRCGRGRTGIQFDRNERAVLRCLEQALGREKAVALKEIGRQTGLSDRAIKGVVESLRSAHGLKVGSCRAQPDLQTHGVGYYWITNAEELLDTVRPFVRQAVTMLRTADALTGGRYGFARAALERAGQLRLEL